MMSEIGLQSLYINRHMREMEEQKEKTRKRNLLVLIWSYLNEQGYINTAESLYEEVTINLHQYEVCDNIDLEVILQEFEVFHFAKFHKYPQLVKKLNEEKRNQLNNKKKLLNKSRNASQNMMENNQNTIYSKQLENNNEMNNKNEMQNNFIKQGNKSPEEVNLFIEGTVVGCNNNEKSKMNSEFANEGRTRLLKPLGTFLKYNEEWSELSKVISRDIYLENPNVKWNDIIGLSSAKNLIKEAVVYPIKYPDLFSGLLSPWKGLLLFGPPGTGKTMLAKAVATECQTTFFNISASTIISKWRGDSEKLIRVLFELARFHAPSTIFLDELDSLMSHRDTEAGNEHEASRRMKTELLIQMDGLSRSNDLVFVLAASNIPWDLDHAILRRLEKRILVPLPNTEVRISLFEQFLPPKIIQNKIISINSQLDYYTLADKTVGYSGADIKLVCKESVMNCLRKIFNLLEQHIQGHELPQTTLHPIETTDVLSAISRTKPSARNFVDKYTSWQEEYGSI